MAADRTIGTRIKRARERKRWTQQQLADALNVNIKTVDNWENGRTEPRSSIGALEAVLSVRLDGPEPEPEIPEILRRQVAALTPRQRRWMRDWLAAELDEDGEDPPRAARA